MDRNTISCALDDDAEAGLLKDVLIVNGLELNMSCTTYKVAGTALFSLQKQMVLPYFEETSQ